MSLVALGSFDALADAYDRFRTGYGPELYAAIAAYGYDPAGAALDLACGTGLVARELLASAAGVVGVDVSEPMLARARARVTGARFVQARAEALPFERGTFALGACAQAFHWFDQPAAIAELRRVVRPGGTVAIWWKGLMRGDAVRYARENAAAELGLAETPNYVAERFTAFQSSGLADRRLRIVPWRIETTVEEFMGYERSRANARDIYGDALPAYLAALERRLGSAESALAIGYVQMLYLGRVPEAG